jgi:hypothetical protein
MIYAVLLGSGLVAGTKDAIPVVRFLSLPATCRSAARARYY